MSITLFSQASETVSATGSNSGGTIGLEFSVSSAGTLNALWLYSPSGWSLAALPSTIALYKVTGTSLVVSQASVTWSGSAGSGWVRAAFTSPPSLTASTNYMAAAFLGAGSNWFTYNDAYSWPASNGPISAPAGQGFYSTTATAVAYPSSQLSGYNWFLDLEVSPTGATSTGAVSLAGMSVSGSGSATLVISATGSVSLATMAASGSGSQSPIVTGAGSASLATMAGSGLAAESITVAGSASLAKMSAGGSAAEAVTGAGSASLATMHAVGASGSLVSVSGSASLATMAAEGAGAEAIGAAGSASLATFAADGNGNVVPLAVTATGSIGLASMHATGTAAETVAASGVITDEAGNPIFDESGAELLDESGTTGGGGGTPAATTSVQVLVDWVNNPIGPNAVAGSNWTDISEYVRWDKGLSVTRGRQDNISSVQSGRVSFTVDNSSGNFTPGKSASIWYPGVKQGRRVQVNVKDESGTLHTRFDGMLSEIDIAETVTGQEATAQIICADVLAVLNRGDNLSCTTVEYAASLGPIYQYILNEPSGSVGVKDSSGNNGPMLVPRTYNGQLFPVTPIAGYEGTVTTPTYAYASGNNPVEGAVPPVIYTSATAVNTAGITSPLQSAQFGATITATATNFAATGCSAQFEGLLPNPIVIGGGNEYFVTAWVWPNVAASNIGYVNYCMAALCLGNSHTGQTLSIGTVPTTGEYYGQYYQNFLRNGTTLTGQVNYLPPAETFQGPAQIGLVINGTSVSLYYAFPGADGGTYNGTTSSFTVPAGSVFNFLCIGGMMSGGLGWIGNVSNVCVYDQIPSTPVLGFMSQLGMSGNMFLSATTPPGLAMSWAGIPSYWKGTEDSTGSLWDYMDISGSNYVSVLQTGSQVEKGSYFVNAAGKINLYSRSRRMGYGSPKLSLPPGSYNVGLEPKWTDQYLINSEALVNQRGGQGVLAQNNASMEAYGEYPNGSLQSPQQQPCMSLVKSYVTSATNGGTAPVTPLFSNDQMLDIGSWDVNVSGDPAMKLAAITIGMLDNPTPGPDYVAPSDLFSVEIGDVITLGENLPWWPDEPLAGELFVEGINETYNLSKGDISWYTSPAAQGRAWVLGDSTYGVLDSTARLGVSSYIGNFGELPNVPAFATSMNATAGGGYVGSRDMAGISRSLATQLKPPLLFASQQGVEQTIAAGAPYTLDWDSVYVDNYQGLGINQPGDYIIPLSGWYEIYLTIIWGTNAVGMRYIWLRQSQQGGAVRQIAPVSCSAPSVGGCGLTTSALVYCYRGDAISAGLSHDSNSSVITVISNGGSHMSVRFVGSGPNRN